MKASRCKLCGVAEWQHVCTKGGDATSPQSPLATYEAAPVITETVAEAPIVTLTSSEPLVVEAFSERRGFDKKAYQREYMRARRERMRKP